MYLHRIVRLTPVLAVAVLFFMTLFPRLDSGPLWQQFSSSHQLCRDTWWATLLYVQNYAAAGRMVSYSRCNRYMDIWEWLRKVCCTLRLFRNV